MSVAGVGESRVRRDCPCAVCVTPGQVDLDLLLTKATAVKAALGPLLMNQEAGKAEQNVISKIEDGLTTESKDEWGGHVSAERVKLDTRMEKNDAAVEVAMTRLNDLKLTVAERVACKLATAARKYQAALKRADPSTRAQLEQFTAKAQKLANVRELKPANVRELKAGEYVKVSHHGEMTKAEVLSKVLKVDGNGDVMYKLSVLNSVSVQNAEPEETACLIFRARHVIYATEKHSQKLYVPSNLKGTDASTLETTDDNFLVCMYSDAEASRAFLDGGFAERIADKVNEARNETPSPQKYKVYVTTVVGKLKSETRVMEKVMEKYEGDYSKLCDLARMEFRCRDVAAMEAVLDRIAEDSDVEILLIKDRLRETFDARITNGYRDVLINVRHAANGHICEIQITLKSLADIKNGPDGHAVYQLVRVLGLNDESTIEFTGAPTAKAIEGVRRGMIKKLHLLDGGTMTPETFQDLVEALAAPTCMLTSFGASSLKQRTVRLSCSTLNGGPSFAFPANTAPSALFCERVIENLQDQLRTVECSATGLVGGFPESLYDCTELTVLDFGQEKGMTGELLPKIKKLTKLRRLMTWETGMTGPLPTTEICELRDLVTMQTHHMDDIQLLDGTWTVSEHASKDGEKKTTTVCATAMECYEPACHTLTAATIRDIRNGTIKKLSLSGKQSAVPPKTFKDLVAALSAPSCILAMFKVDDGFKFPENTAPGDLFCAAVVKSLKRTLKYVEISATGLSGPFPGLLCECTELTYLCLDEEPGVTGQLPPQIGQCCKLSKILIQSAGLTGPLPKELGNIPHLDGVITDNSEDIGCTDGTWNVEAHAAKDGETHEYEHELYAEAHANYDPPCHTLTPADIEGIKKGTITNVALTTGPPMCKETFDELVGALSTCTCELNHFTADGRPTSDNVRDSGIFPVKPSMTAPGDFFSANAVAALKNTLSILHCHHSGFVGPFPESLYECTQLSSLIFNEPGVTGTISPKIGQLINLTTFHTYESDMMGDLPKEFGNLKSLTSMKAHNYRLFGCEDKIWCVYKEAAREQTEDGDLHVNNAHHSFEDARKDYQHRDPSDSDKTQFQEIKNKIDAKEKLTDEEAKLATEWNLHDEESWLWHPGMLVEWMRTHHAPRE